MRKVINFQTVPVDDLVLKGIRPEADPPKPVVLVVDDEVVIADTLAAILAQNGMTAMTAYDGPSALKIARVIPPDLLLSDVVMPGMSGIELAITVRQIIPDCKILLFSGQAMNADLLARAGAEGEDLTILAKPIHPTELLANITDRLGARVSKRSRVHV
jgi:CheY-like chemotaxis protein